MTGTTPPPSSSATAAELDFAVTEYAQRVARLKDEMIKGGLDAVLLTTDAYFRYFSGFNTQFWASTTRPWYLIIPAQGAGPIAVVPGNGLEGFRKTASVAQVEVFPSPNPDDEGISIVAEMLKQHAPAGSRIGAELGPECRLGMPFQDFVRLQGLIAPVDVVDASPILRQVRMVKSEQEVALIAQACRIAGRMYEVVPSVAASGVSEQDVAHQLAAEAFNKGADTIPYLPVVAAPGGYRDSISGPTKRPIQHGDVLYVDTGLTVSHYFCDYNRNWAIGAALDLTRKAYDIGAQAVEAGIAAAKPGARICDIWRAMAEMMADFAPATEIGRMGHGVGLEITEPPSITATDLTVLEPGMVLAIEPGVSYGNGMQLIHEENIVITERGCRMLTECAPAQLPIL